MTKKERAKLRRQRRNRRIALTIAAIVVIAAFAIGGTLAWLTDDTDPITNTFTASDIDIDLDESDDLDLKMVPGCEIAKDPKVTVKAGSEACWLFVEVEESSNLKDFITYAIADGWTALTGVDGVYYREVADLTGEGVSAQTFSVLNGDKVTVLQDVTKTDLSALTADTRPALTFTAYACQKDNVTSASAAWAIAKPVTSST